ncbi:MAG: phage tail assembly protein T [Planctomycetota bacterium]|jgi:hypothetical protein
MSVEEFFEYAAFNQVEPFGNDRADMYAAIVPHMLGNFMSKKGKGAPYEDYLLSNMLSEGEKRKPRKGQTQAEMEKTLKDLFLSTKKP